MNGLNVFDKLIVAHDNGTPAPSARGAIVRALNEINVMFLFEMQLQQSGSEALITPHNTTQQRLPLMGRI